MNCRIDLHAAQQFEHGHVAHCFSAMSSGKTYRFRSSSSHGRSRSRGARVNPMFLLRLHARAGNGPGSIVQVEFLGPSLDRLVSPGGRQNREFQTAGADALNLSQPRHKPGDIREGDGLVITTRLFFARAGSSWLRWPFQRAGFSPERKPGLSPKSGRSRSAPAAGSPFGFRCPYRFEDFQDQTGIDVLNGQGADHRPHVGF